MLKVQKEVDKSSASDFFSLEMSHNLTKNLKLKYL